jgi:hypothetical protein
LAVSVLGTADAATIDGHELRVAAWSTEKEIKLARDLQDELEHWNYNACTLFVKGVDENLADLVARQQKWLARKQAVVTAAGATGGEGGYSKGKEDEEAATMPLTSGDFTTRVQALEFIPAKHYANGMTGYSFKPDGDQGSGYYRRHDAFSHRDSRAGAGAGATTAAHTTVAVGAMRTSSAGSSHEMNDSTDSMGIGSSSIEIDDPVEFLRHRVVPDDDSSLRCITEPLYLRKTFSVFGIYFQGSMSQRAGDSWALVTLGQASLARVLAKPRPKELASLEIDVVDIQKAMASTGMFHQTWEAGEKKAVREHSLLVADRNRLWRYISPGGDDERGWQKVGRAIRAVSRMSLSLRASVSHVRAEGEPVVEAPTVAPASTPEPPPAPTPELPPEGIPAGTQP